MIDWDGKDIFFPSSLPSLFLLIPSITWSLLLNLEENNDAATPSILWVCPSLSRHRFLNIKTEAPSPQPDSAKFSNP